MTTRDAVNEGSSSVGDGAVGETGQAIPVDASAEAPCAWVISDAPLEVVGEFITPETRKRDVAGAVTPEQSSHQVAAQPWIWDLIGLMTAEPSGPPH